MADLGKTLIIAGLLIFVAAVAWWVLYFEQFHGLEVKQASACFYYFEENCTPSALDKLLQESRVPPYSPIAFWGSVAIFSLGVIVLALSPFRHH